MSGCPAKRLVGTGVLIAIMVLLIPSSVSCSKPPPPTAAFTVSYVSGELLIADPIAGLAPLVVEFTDQSSGEITSWRWSLGDGIVVEGGGDDARHFTHEYKTLNSSGYIVTLLVRGPGGKDVAEQSGVVTIFKCSEAANAELSQAKQAVQKCLSAAGTAALDAAVAAWDGSPDQVTAGGRDAADYLGVWKHFKATYEVGQDGTIVSGTDVSWGCVFWSATSLGGARWGEKT